LFLHFIFITILLVFGITLVKKYIRNKEKHREEDMMKSVERYFEIPNAAKSMGLVTKDNRDSYFTIQ